MMAAYKFLGSLLLLNTIKADPCAPPQIRLRNNTLNKTIAVVLRGEAFRNTGQQHVRGTCGCALAWKTQRRIADDHEKWFAALGRRGYGVDVFAATRPCSDTNATYNATETLQEWYGPRMKMSVEDVDDGLPFAQVRNRDRAIALVRDYAHEHGVNYAYVFIMRWDYKIDVSKWRPRCVLDGTLKDSRHLIWRMKDQDQMQLVPGALAACFYKQNADRSAVLNGTRLVRPSDCTWDACLEHVWIRTGGLGRPPKHPPLVVSHLWKHGECPTPWAEKVVHRAGPHIGKGRLKDIAACERADADQRRVDHWQACRDGAPGQMQRTGLGCIRNGSVVYETASSPNTTAVPPFDSATHWLAKKKEHWTAKVPFLPGKPIPPKGVRRGEEGREVFV